MNGLSQRLIFGVEFALLIVDIFLFFAFVCLLFSFL